MIRVSISRYGSDAGAGECSGEYAVRVLVTGHAVYSNPLTALFFSAVTKKNKNIVCAAVSALSINLLKSVILIAGLEPECEQRNGYLSIIIKINDTDPDRLSVLNTLLGSFSLGILDLKKNYPDLIEAENIKWDDLQSALRQRPEDLKS